MASKTTGNRTTGATNKSTGTKGTKKTGPQPIPINSGLTSHESAVENAPATQAYPGIEEEIRRRAYELYEQRGRQGGSGIPPLPWMMAPGRMSQAWRAALGSWVSVSLIAFFVWLLAGHPDNLWFLWIAGPYGLILLGRWVSGGDAPGRRHRGH